MRGIERVAMACLAASPEKQLVVVRPSCSRKTRKNTCYPRPKKFDLAVKERKAWERGKVG